MRTFSWLRPLTKGLGHARAPDPGGSTTRALHKPAKRLAQQQASHQTQSTTQSHLHPSPIQSLPKSAHPLTNIFNTLFPVISHSARATLHAAPSSLAQSHASLASRNLSHAARASVRAGGKSGLNGAGQARPVLRGGGLTGPPPVHHVGLGTARGFATGAGRPVLQNVQNAPQYLRAMLDQEDRLRKEGRGRKGMKARVGRERKAMRKGGFRRSASMQIDVIRESYFPAVEEEVSKSEAIVLIVPLEPTTATTPFDTVSTSSTSTSQGHLFTTPFLSAIRSREEQLLRAQRIFDDVQSVVAAGSASYQLRTGSEPALVVKFDARKWTLMDVRALLGLWDMGEVAGELWYAIGEESDGWTETRRIQGRNARGLEMSRSLSDVTTVSGGTSIYTDSPVVSPSQHLIAEQEYEHDSERDHDHDLAAHDNVLETLQLPSIMFGASFMTPSSSSPPTSPSLISKPTSSRPSLSRSSTSEGISFSLSPVDEKHEFDLHLHDDENYAGEVRDFIQEVNSLSGRFPTSSSGKRSEGWMGNEWGSGSSMASWRI